MTIKMPPHGLDQTCEHCGLLFACCHCTGADEITEEEFEEALNNFDGGTKTIRLYLAQQIAAARIEGVREGWFAQNPLEASQIKLDYYLKARGK